MEKALKIPIYFDSAATTPIDDIVCKEMLNCMSVHGDFANPDSRNHSLGIRAHDLVENARFQVSNLINCETNEIIFTSGTTESNNFALMGIAHALHKKGNHIITVQTEHKSVLETCKHLEKEGFHVTYLKPQSNGLITLDMLKKVITKKTILVSVMHVNNELGIIQDIHEIAYLLKNFNILFHVDAAQSVGKLPINLKELSVDIMSFSAHKLYGPKGIGVLYLRDNLQDIIYPLMYGGGQERGLRAGTSPTHQIVGIGKACALARERFEQDRRHLSELSAYFFERLKEIPHATLNVEHKYCVPNIINFRIKNMDAKYFLATNPAIAASISSACDSGNDKGSYVLRSIGLSSSQIKESIRISLGRFNTMKDIDFLIDKINDAIRKIMESEAGGKF